MDVARAWEILGTDVNHVLRGTADLPTVSAKLKAVEEACGLANKLARKLLAVDHPDRKPGDAAAARRFREVSDALEAVRSHTESFRARVVEIREREKNPPDGFIKIG
jgi:hypothetical protein